MTRKRFVKLLMSAGYSRNFLNDYVLFFFRYSNVYWTKTNERLTYEDHYKMLTGTSENENRGFIRFKKRRHK